MPNIVYSLRAAIRAMRRALPPSSEGSGVASGVCMDVDVFDGADAPPAPDRRIR